MGSSAIDRSGSIPIKEQLRQWVLARIRSEEFKAGQPIPSINRLARELGIGRETVRLSLDTLVQRGVLVPEQGKGYFVAGRSSRAHRVALLGRVGGVYTRPIYDGLTEVLGEEASVMLLDCRASRQMTKALMENLAYNLSVDRLLVVPPRGREEELQQVLDPFRRYFRVGWLDRAPPDTRDATFLCDYAQCVRLALQHLGKCKVDRLAYFSRQQEDGSVFSAMRTEFRKLAPGGEVLTEWEQIRDRAGAGGGGRLGVMAEIDTEAVYLQSRLLADGVNVPAEVAMVSCDNSELTELVTPGISSVDPGFEELGRRAAEWVLAEEGGEVERFVAVPVLAVRTSTAAPRDRAKGRRS